MVFSSEGVLSGDDGSELARVQDSTAAHARLTVGTATYEIVRTETLRERFQLLDADSRLVYEFHPGLRPGGIVALASDEPVAHLIKPLLGRGWRIVTATGEQIVVKRSQGLAGPIVSGDGELVPPALEIALPAMMAAGGDLPRMLAFSCWMIAGWESEIRRGPR